MTPNQDQIDRAFRYHKPSQSDADSIALLRADCKGLAEAVDRLCPDGREKSIALTKIEEVSMWANAAIVRRER